MIASLRGLLLEKTPEAVVIEAGGVGYAVTITASAWKALPPVQSETRLHIHTHPVQDGGLHLYGFADADERRTFEALISVQGVGPRVAVALLSAVSLADLVRYISTGDVGRLTQVRGIGRKIAERLTLELRDKIGAVIAGGAPAPSAPVAGRLGEVQAALVALGYRPAEIEPVLPALDPAAPAPELVKQALAALRRK